MMLNIEFDILLLCFANNDINIHNIIDVKNNEIICINENIGYINGIDKYNLECRDYILIPSRSGRDNLVIMELFAFSFGENSKIGGKIFDITQKPLPFKNFHKLLNNNNELKEKWFAFEDVHLRNDLINWLVAKDISLKDMQCPEIILIESDKSCLPYEYENLAPIECRDCKSRNVNAKYYCMNMSINNNLVDKELRNLLEQKGITNYGILARGKDSIVTVARCANCNSYNVSWDL